ncbi:hypothetical protein ACP4OV_010485 [Aristida adscensionis]
MANNSTGIGRSEGREQSVKNTKELEEQDFLQSERNFSNLPEGYFSSDDVMTVTKMKKQTYCYTEMIQQFLSGSVLQSAEGHKYKEGDMFEAEEAYENSLIMTTSRLQMTQETTATNSLDEEQ